MGGRTHGVQGESWSPAAGCSGVRGVTTHPDGSGYGVHGIAVGRDGTGVFGEADASRGGSTKGVLGSSDAGTGVLGLGQVAGVWGTVRAGAQNGVGVLADNTEGGVALRARGDVEVKGTQNGPIAFTVDVTDPPAGQTAILVRRNVGGTFSLQRVAVGAPDSGGTGFRVLMVPN
jgi:hypothetical protein